MLSHQYGASCDVRKNIARGISQNKACMSTVPHPCDRIFHSEVRDSSCATATLRGRKPSQRDTEIGNVKLAGLLVEMSEVDDDDPTAASVHHIEMYTRCTSFMIRSY